MTLREISDTKEAVVEKLEKIECAVSYQLAMGNHEVLGDYAEMANDLEYELLRLDAMIEEKATHFNTMDKHIQNLKDEWEADRMFDPREED